MVYDLIIYLDDRLSSDTKIDNISFEEMNYNSASNHMKNFNKYSTKKKHIFSQEGSSGRFRIYDGRNLL